MMKQTKLPRIQVSIDDAIRDELEFIQRATGLAKATILTILVREAVAARRAFREQTKGDVQLASEAANKVAALAIAENGGTLTRTGT